MSSTECKEPLSKAQKRRLRKKKNQGSKDKQEALFDHCENLVRDLRAKEERVKLRMSACASAQKSSLKQFKKHCEVKMKERYSKPVDPNDPNDKRNWSMMERRLGHRLKEPLPAREPNNV